MMGRGDDDRQKKSTKRKKNTQTQPIPNPVSSTAPLFFCVPNQPSISSKPRAVMLTKEMLVARRSGGSRNLSSRVHACMHVFVHSCTRTPHPLIRPYIHTSRMYVCVCVRVALRVSRFVSSCVRRTCM